MRVLLLTLLAACQQGVGERCQLHSDCAAGLTCVLMNAGDCFTGGSCQDTGDEGRTCTRSADCATGYTCVATGACTEAGHSTCEAVQDLSMPDDLSRPARD